MTDTTTTTETTWWDYEFEARRKFALDRLENLGRFAAAGRATKADLFDAAYTIWSDYIEGRRMDERFDSPSAAELRSHAPIFARVVAYLASPKDSVGLAQAAWGTSPFEVLLVNPFSGIAVGKLGWFDGNTIVTTLFAVPGAPAEAHTTWSFRGRFGKINEGSEVRVLGFGAIALHPVFGRVS